MIDATKGQEQFRSVAQTSKLASSLKRQAILILGMHRSGTSAVGGVISALGIAGPKNLMGPSNDNPRGYFESTPLSVAHDELLAAAGSSWHDWRQFDPQWFHSSEGEHHRQKIKALLLDEFGDEPLIFIKDPRICRFVPFIGSILAELGFGTVALLPVRNPLEVAQSLKRRNGFALSKSMLLWLRHVLDAEFHSRPMRRCFLSYGQFLLDWRTHMERVSEKIGIAWPKRSGRADAEIDEFLTTKLHRERVSFDDLKKHPEMIPWVRETYDILIPIAEGGENKQSLDKLDYLRAAFDEACRTPAPAMQAEDLAAADNAPLRGRG
jgi:hypothetical protein